MRRIFKDSVQKFFCEDCESFQNMSSLIYCRFSSLMLLAFATKQEVITLLTLRKIKSQLCEMDIGNCEMVDRLRYPSSSSQNQDNDKLFSKNNLRGLHVVDGKVTAKQLGEGSVCDQDAISDITEAQSTSYPQSHSQCADSISSMPTGATCAGGVNGFGLLNNWFCAPIMSCAPFYYHEYDGRYGNDNRNEFSSERFNDGLYSSYFCAQGDYFSRHKTTTYNHSELHKDGDGSICFYFASKFLVAFSIFITLFFLVWVTVS